MSFIFVVNRLGFYDAPPLDPETEIDYCRDKWMNTLPPRVWYGYTREYESRVMKYYDGSVTVASEYYWSRGSLGQPGYICKMEEDGSMSVAEEFSSRGVFSCNPHLPLVIIPEDPTTCALTNQKKVMHALHFVHALNPDGISYASTDDLSQIPIQYSACQKHLDGARSSLIPSLVPPSYEPPTTPPRRSRGLSGDLGILLGMMAFSRNTVEEVFVGRSPLWRNRVWHESDHLPRLCTPLAQPPESRGPLTEVQKTQLIPANAPSASWWSCAWTPTTPARLTSGCKASSGEIARS